MSGFIHRIYISENHNYFGHHDQPSGDHSIQDLAEAHCVKGCGIEGDRFFSFKNDYKGQITFFEHEVYLRLCEQFGVHGKEASVFRRNVITQGIELNSLIGQKFELQGVQFFGVQECAPCHWMNEAFHPGAEQAIRGHGGLRARILTDGILRPGIANLTWVTP